MDNKELLELAAKAAGIGWDRTEECWYGDPYVRKDWNPLTDDGDALRVAVKLRFDLVIGGGRTLVYADGLQIAEYHLEDPTAATRRAIVRAAAEIGKVLDRQPKSDRPPLEEPHE
jgi:hypothetical protein